MPVRTTIAQRRLFFERHTSGESYAKIGDDMGYSMECVRYWCRRQRDGGKVTTRYQRESPGILSSFDPRMPEAILQLRVQHPGWGPGPIRLALQKDPDLAELEIPSRSQIGRYLHQFAAFRRQRYPKTAGTRPNQATRVHQRWQLDFKMGIALDDGTLVNLHNVRDPVGAACIGSYVYPCGKVGDYPAKINLPEVQTTLRRCFIQWGTLPEEIQTDHDSGLIGTQPGGFPPRFTLWLKALGIEHLLIRFGRPTDNAEVERCQRTINNYAIKGNESCDLQGLQDALNKATHELVYELPSNAKQCAGRTPVDAHPGLMDQPRPFLMDSETLQFDLGRVDQYLSTFIWQRKVGKTGQTYIADKAYSVGRSYARQQVLVRFDPADRNLVFYREEEPDIEIKRHHIKQLEPEDIMGIRTDPILNQIVQLKLPLSTLQSVEV